mmetsp:Transcript_15058/g.32296  ORF Transcript_15058/g.32296 Transcript_15058/m.32296 type:complete len:219 (+) Transcript_15058:1276-1932(+)
MDDRQTFLWQNLDGIIVASGIDYRPTATVDLLCQKHNNCGSRCLLKGIWMLVEVGFPVRSGLQFIHNEIAKVCCRKARDLFDPIFYGLLCHRCQSPLPKHDTFDSGIFFWLRVQLEVVNGINAHGFDLVFCGFHQGVGFATGQEIVDQVECWMKRFDVLKERTVASCIQSNSFRHPVVDNVLLFHVRLNRGSSQYIGRVERNHNDGNVDVLGVGFLSL